MFGGGFAPLCIRIDLDSYDGDWRHVQRFRNKSGWLVVAEARLISADDRWTTDVVAAVDEWGQAIPAFMAPNLLACAWGHPEPCCDYPPPELGKALGDALRALLASWLRDNRTELRILNEQQEQQIDLLESSASRFVNTGLRQIAELRRRRRLLAPTDAARATIDAIIGDIERESDAAQEALVERRTEIRAEFEERERRLIKQARATANAGRKTYINWHAQAEPSEARSTFETLWRTPADAQYGIALPQGAGLSSLQADAVREQRRAEAEQARLERRAANLAAAIDSPVPLRRRDRDELRREARLVQAALQRLRTERAHSRTRA